MSTPAGRAREILTIRAVGFDWGVVVHDVEEILPHRPAVRAPGSAPFVEGIVRYRDGVLPVVDLSARFRLPPGAGGEGRAERAGGTTARRTLVIRISGGLAGLTVDEVVGSRLADEAQLVPLPRMAASPVARGCLTDPGGNLLVILDPRAILETDAPLDLPRTVGWDRPAEEPAPAAESPTVAPAAIPAAAPAAPVPRRVPDPPAERRPEAPAAASPGRPADPPTIRPANVSPPEPPVAPAATRRPAPHLPVPGAEAPAPLPPVKPARPTPPPASPPPAARSPAARPDSPSRLDRPFRKPPLVKPSTAPRSVPVPEAPTAPPPAMPPAWLPVPPGHPPEEGATRPPASAAAEAAEPPTFPTRVAPLPPPPGRPVAASPGFSCEPRPTQPPRRAVGWFAAAAAVVLVLGAGWLLANRRAGAPPVPTTTARLDSPEVATGGTSQPATETSAVVTTAPAPVKRRQSEPPRLVLTLEEAAPRQGIAGDGEAAGERRAPAGVTQTTADGKTVEVAEYTVVPGDTLWSIARRFTRNPFRYREIASENDVRNPDLIFPGQPLTLRIRRAPQAPAGSQP